MPEEKKRKPRRARAFCFTYNNPSPDYDYKTLLCEYIIVGNEIAPETKTPHHQGYIRFKSATSFASAKNKLPLGCHIEISKGSPQQNVKYCSKESIFYEFGDRPKMGKRTDIDDMKEMLAGGASMTDIIEHSNNYQTMRCAELILKYTERKRSWKPIVTWIHGATGTGKTRKAYADMTDPWISGKNLKWWDGYDAHKHVIFDDFRGDFCTFHELLRILDRYPYRIENKGGSRQLLATHITITCPYPPDTVYQNREDIQQLLRRIDHTILM